MKALQFRQCTFLAFLGACEFLSLLAGYYVVTFVLMNVLNPLSAGTGFWRPLQTVWIQMRRHRTWRLIRIQTVCYSDSILWKKIKENANFRNSADDILADNKFPSMQRVNKYRQSSAPVCCMNLSFNLNYV